MGSGASTENSPRGLSGAKYAAGGGSAVSNAFESNPFDANSFNNDSTTRGGQVMSERKLKKMALGIPGYKDVQRDYDETLEALGKFNTNKKEEWTTPNYDGSGPVVQEKLYDGHAYGKSAKGPNPVEATIDPRALQRQKQQARAGGQAAPSGPPQQRSIGGKPPPPRRPKPPASQSGSTSGTRAAGGGAAAASALSNPGMREISAPTTLEPPVAALQGAPNAKPTTPVNTGMSPMMQSTGARGAPSSRLGQQSQRSQASGGMLAGATAIVEKHSATTTPPRTHGPGSTQSPSRASGNESLSVSPMVQSATSSTPIKTVKSTPVKKQKPTIDESESEGDSDEGEEDGIYEWTSMDTSANYAHAQKTASGPGPRTPPTGNFASKSNATSQLKAPNHPPPQNSTPTGGNGKPLPVKPFPGEDGIDDMYATFGPGMIEPALTPKKDSRVPSLAIASPSTPSGSSKSGSSSTGLSLNLAGVGSQNSSASSAVNANPPSSKGAQTPPQVSQRKPTGDRPLPINSSPLPSNKMMSSGGPGAPPRNAPGDSQRLAPSRNAPPKPSQKNPHEVKETTDVKRNKAQLPQALTHAKPTTGDWLKKRYIVNNYILLDGLGTGSYGEVRLCKDRTTDNLYAVKIFSKDMLRKKKGGSTETYFEDVKREIAVMKKLLHPNVLRLFEVLDDPNVNKMYLILEYMKKGDLIGLLQRNSPPGADEMLGGFSPLSDLELWNIFRQVAAGIRYLHYQNIVHGDIKPQNLLMGEDGVIKIADFGIAKMLHASGTKLMESSGTPAFMSPELFDTEVNFSGQLADVWAIGATMFMLKFGRPPFIAKNVVTLSQKIQGDPLVFPAPLDSKLQDLLENMLTKDPTKRFTLQQVIMHPWMRVQPAPPVPSQKSGKEGKSAPSSTRNFAPPSTYEESEAAAMKKPIAKVNNDDIYMSIGFNKTSVQNAVDDVGGAIVEETDDGDTDLMATKWGADLFELVDDAGSDSDSDGDVDTVDESVDSSKKGSSHDMTGKVRGPVGTNTGERSEMTNEEETMRANRFKKSSTKQRRSNESMDTGSISEDNTAAQGSSTTDIVSLANPIPKSFSPSEKIADDDELEESTGQITMAEFGAMMDTLALQPKSKDLSSAAPLNIEVKPASFSVQLRNLKNGVGAAFHSEQGQRPDQEDRCVLLPDVSTMRALQGSSKINSVTSETLQKFSIAAVFDGHSGWQCSQYLSQHLIPALVLHEKFLNKQPDVAILETFRMMDAKITALLRKEECNAGSTAIIALYDGRRHVFTVANVGDSMCVLSRGGRAVKLHRVHRFSSSDECLPEKERVEAAGSAVVNNRVDGILAVSRAFGDVSFKTGPTGAAPVIAVPDICSEVITPMTEFGVIASDGLWDVMEPQLVVNFVRKMVNKKNDLQEVAAELVREALARGSVDNVTVLILSFHMTNPPKEEG